MGNQQHIAVIGGGAAGFFAALSIKAHLPSASVSIYEKSKKVLAKVKISGGGRCNVTHACFSPSQLAKHYPRGGKQLKKAFGRWQAQDTVDWFESRGVALKTEADGRMFPTSDSSQSIIDCLQREAERLGVEVHLQCGIARIERLAPGFRLHLMNGKAVEAQRVVVATGGSPKLAGFDWLAQLGHSIAPPVPSLFTFNLPGHPICQLMGVVASNAMVRIQGSKLSSTGPLLVTHWGMSGPAVLRLSAFGARLLHEQNYHYTVLVGWTGIGNEETLRSELKEHATAHARQQLAKNNPFGLPKRLWEYLLLRVEVAPDSPWMELGKKALNRLVNVLMNDAYEARGKTTFKEEFVTAGGVELREIDFKRFKSKQFEHMYLAGEVLNIDAVTGGFNFQAAWTGAYIASQAVVDNF